MLPFLWVFDGIVVCDYGGDSVGCGYGGVATCVVDYVVDSVVGYVGGVVVGVVVWLCYWL